ncbi:MAG: FAD-binding oxidoreductase, partial [Chloroflexota bacterium]
DDVIAALHCPNDGIADHTQTTQSFAQAAQRAGAQICEQTVVETVDIQGGQIKAVITTQGERISVGKAVILLSNTHVPKLLQQHFNLTLPLWLMWPQVMLTDPIDPLPMRHLVGHAHRTLSIKPHFADESSVGQVMISGGWLGQWDASQNRGVTRPDQVAGNLAEAVAVYPDLIGIGVAEADAGRPEMITVDDIPIIDTVSGAENLFYATGWSGHGWAIAPTVTRLLAEWIWSNQQPELLKPFSYQRFL